VHHRRKPTGAWPGGKTLDVAELRGDRVAQHPGDPENGGEQGDVAVLGAETAHLALELVDLPLEVIDHRIETSTSEPWVG
jgi:hypothetical protein